MSKVNVEVTKYLNSIAAKLLVAGLTIDEFSECGTVDDVKAALSARNINTDGGAPTPIFNDAAQDLLAKEEPEEEAEVKSGIWLNIDLKKGDRNLRVAGISLDSDYNRFLDKEKTKPNGLVMAIINTIDKHGLEAAQEGLQFTVNITKQGVASVAADTDLLG